jgi:hypothetical protein
VISVVGPTVDRAFLTREGLKITSTLMAESVCSGAKVGWVGRELPGLPGRAQPHRPPWRPASPREWAWSVGGIQPGEPVGLRTVELSALRTPRPLPPAPPGQLRLDRLPAGRHHRLGRLPADRRRRQDPDRAR